MSVIKALEHKDNLERMCSNLEAQGKTEEQRRIHIFAYLDQAKKEHLKENE